MVVGAKQQQWEGEAEDCDDEALAVAKRAVKSVPMTERSECFVVLNCIDIHIKSRGCMCRILRGFSAGNWRTALATW